MAKTATVDLTTGRVTLAETSPELLRDYLGGRGLGARLLYDLVGPEVDPLGPDNYLIFTAGSAGRLALAHVGADARHLQVAARPAPTAMPTPAGRSWRSCAMPATTPCW